MTSFKPITTSADVILKIFYFSEKIKVDISCESLTSLISSENNNNTILLDALKVYSFHKDLNDFSLHCFKQLGPEILCKMLPWSVCQNT